MAMEKRNTVNSLPYGKKVEQSKVEEMTEKFVSLGIICKQSANFHNHLTYNQSEGKDPSLALFKISILSKTGTYKTILFTKRQQNELYNALVTESAKVGTKLPQSVLEAYDDMTNYFIKVAADEAYLNSEEYRQAKSHTDRVKAEENEAKELESARKYAALKEASEKNLEEVAQAKIAQYDEALENARRIREEAEANSVEHPPLDAKQVQKEREALKELERRLKAPFHAAEDGTKENRTHRRW